MEKKHALGLPQGSIRAIIAWTTIGSTAIAFLVLAVWSAIVQSADVLKEVIDGAGVWFAIVTMIATFYFNTGQASDSMKEAQELLNGKK